MSAKIDVLAVMDRTASHEVSFLCKIKSSALSEYEASARQARAAVAELITCSRVTIAAFEALGNASGVLNNIEAHRECERALIKQKAALANIGPQS